MTIATCARLALAGVSDDVRRDPAQDLADAVRAHLGLRVQPAETCGERGDGGGCDGVSIIDSGVILDGPTARRGNFTLMHELGQHLVENSVECLSWMAVQLAPNRVLEQVFDQTTALSYLGYDSGVAVGKVSLSIDEDLLDEARARAGRRELSSYVNEALRRQLQRDRLTELLAEMEVETGPIPDDVMEEARRLWRAPAAKRRRRA